eukprot:7734386-Karenia_brevis.AAC.1
MTGSEKSESFRPHYVLYSIRTLGVYTPGIYTTGESALWGCTLQGSEESRATNFGFEALHRQGQHRG